MTSLYQSRDEVLTTRNILVAYTAAYRGVYQKAPLCEHQEGRGFYVEGTWRDRRWMLLEVERLRQEAIAKALDSQNSSPVKDVMRLIRHLSRL